MGAAALGLVAVAGHWGARGARVVPLAVMLAGIAALVAVGRWLARDGVLRAPLLRERGVNLLAARPGVVPRLWLCAHLDTKSQPVPSLVRGAGIVLQGVGVLAMLMLALMAALGATAPFVVWAATAAVTLVCAIPVVLSVVGSRSPGALDNASGVATVLAAAAELRNHPQVGVLLTDAEELGLAGARAWAAGNAGSGTVVLNCDGVDDAGDIRIMYTGRAPVELFFAARRAMETTGIAYHARRLPLGLLTDSVAFASAGCPSVTFSRGTLRSLARVHSTRDDLAHLRGLGIADTAALMAGTARQLAARAPTLR